MASNESELISKVHGLLSEGRIGEANTALAQHIDAHPAPTAAAPADPAPAAPPRPAQTVLQELLTAMVNHLGAPPVLQDLLDELIASL